jgi:hypothetical protein
MYATGIGLVIEGIKRFEAEKEKMEAERPEPEPIQEPMKPRFFRLGIGRKKPGKVQEEAVVEEVAEGTARKDPKEGISDRIIRSFFDFLVEKNE